MNIELASIYTEEQIYISIFISLYSQNETHANVQKLLFAFAYSERYTT